MPATLNEGCRLFHVPDLRMLKLIPLFAMYAFVVAGTAFADSHDLNFQEQAVARQLAEQPEWRALLHYHDKGSYVDDASFFLAPEGAEDPAAELHATLQALVNEPATRCRFPARYNWLSSQLDFAGLAVAAEACPAV